jgi:hypothetical protein
MCSYRIRNTTWKNGQSELHESFDQNMNGWIILSCMCIEKLSLNKNLCKETKKEEIDMNSSSGFRIRDEQFNLQLSMCCFLISLSLHKFSFKLKF